VAERTSITTDVAGRRVLAKVAGNGDEARRLEREAALLDAARHPGVVEVVGVDGHGVGAILLTAHVEGPTLAQLGRLPVEEGAGLLAALASTLADLHELGLVHGAVAPEHVIVGPGGRPVLCGLAYGGREGDPLGPAPALPRAFCDPARADAETLTPAFDVFALGALAGVLAPDPPPGHVLARLAEEATADDPTARPGARALARALQREVPGARLPRGLPAPPPPPRPLPTPADPLAAWRRERGGLGARRRRAPRRALGVVAAIATVAVAGGVLAVAGSRSGPAPALSTEPAEPAAEPYDPPPPGDVQPGPTTTRAGLAPPSTSTTAVPRRRDCPLAVAVLQADVDGDGCPEGLRYADGVLEAGEVRWALGQAGDQVATGDWGCQGSRTVALFRPSTGELFRFDGWASPGQDLKATAVARVPGGVVLRAADVDRDGCHEAVVERGTGAAEVVRLPPPRP
jgi:hypothetical protein